MRNVCVLRSPSMVCVDGPYQEAVEDAVASVGDDVVWHWRSESSDLGVSLPQQAQNIIKSSDPSQKIDVVLLPGLEAPYQASYFTRVLSSNNQANPIVQMSTLGMAPYDRAFTMAVALCRHFAWENVALLSSDDHHMRSAQGLRQKLASAGVHIRRHQIFSTDISPVQEEASRSSKSAVAVSSSCN